MPTYLRRTAGRSADSFGAVNLLTLACLACTASSSDAPFADPPTLLSVQAPDPLLLGSAIEVKGLALSRLGTAPYLQISRGAELIARLSPAGTAEGPTLRFIADANLLAALGVDTSGPGEARAGERGMSLVRFTLVAGSVVAATTTHDQAPAFSTSLEGLLRVAARLDVTLDAVPEGAYYRNDVEILVGGGFVTPDEGRVHAHVVGRFQRTRFQHPGFQHPGREAKTVDVRLPVLPVESGHRDRGLLRLGTELGGLSPGHLEGHLQLESTLMGGAQSRSKRLPLSIRFRAPELFLLTPEVASVGRLVRVGGAGFIGGQSGEATWLELSGIFSPLGGAPTRIDHTEVPRFRSGSSAIVQVEPEVRAGRVVSALFGAAEGRFEGTARVVTRRHAETSASERRHVSLTLGPIVQVVTLNFLAGFYASLSRFGLAEAAPEVEARALRRLRDLYRDWNIQFRIDMPKDFSPNVVTVIDINGPDPNGVGLFGYDNTPGKDVNNLRMFDRIGGRNAITQADGAAGYGGVFIDSFLSWSSHPELPSPPPRASPQPDPTFDEVFDPVRRRAATRTEAVTAALGPAERGATRIAAVRRAIDALGAMIGETAAHEFGHSLGLADPSGPSTVFHNRGDSEGCLMDPGGARPLGERMALPGFARTRLCHDHARYLTRILPRR